MRSLCRYGAALALTLFACASSYATEATDIVEKYAAAIRIQNFAVAAGFVKPKDLADFKSAFMPIYAAEQKEGVRGFLDATFGEKAKPEEATGAEPAVFFERVMRFVVNLSDIQGKHLDVVETRVLGEVAEGLSIVHVVVRNELKLGTTRSSRVEVISAEKEGGAWKVLLPEKLRMMGNMMEHQLAMRKLVTPAN